MRIFFTHAQVLCWSNVCCRLVLQWNLFITDKLVAEILSFIWMLSFRKGYDLIPMYWAL